MVNQRWILYLFLSTMALLLAGCGNSGSTLDVQNPAPPPAAAVSIAFQPAPASSVLVNSITPITAVVSNDSSGTGVDWSLTCQNSGNCGTLSALHTSSGIPTVFTPPPTLSGNSEIVNIAGFATADHTKNVLASITVSAFGSNLSGSFVLQAQGVDTNSNPYQFAGVVALDGNGGITSGEQTLNFYYTNPTTGNNSYLSASESIVSAGSSYFLGPDGRGTITLLPNNADIGIEVFSFVYLSSSHGLIAQVTLTSVATTIVSGTGTMDAQTWTSNSPPLSNGYAFAVIGSDFNGAGPSAIGGILNIDSLPNNPNNISGAGSVADQNLAGTESSNHKVSGVVSTPDPFGAVTLSLSVPTFSSTTAFQFTGYMVDSAHVKLIEADSGGSGWVAGIAIGQTPPVGGFSDASFSGTYVFGVLGVDASNGNTTPSTLTSVGVVSADGNGDVTSGYTDTILEAFPIQISSQFCGKLPTYTVDSTGTGRGHFSFSCPEPPNPTWGATLHFYLTGNGNYPALILENGNYNPNTGNGYPFLGTGIAYPQSAAPLTFSGTYGFSFIQEELQNATENSGTGQMTAGSALTPPLSGVVDVNSNFNFDSDVPFSGTLDSPSSTGVFSATLTSAIFSVSPFAVDFYIIDSGHGFFVETDSFNVTNTGTGVASFGYYAAQTLPQPPASSSKKQHRQ